MSDLQATISENSMIPAPKRTEQLVMFTGRRLQWLLWILWFHIYVLSSKIFSSRPVGSKRGLLQPYNNSRVYKWCNCLVWMMMVVWWCDGVMVCRHAIMPFVMMSVILEWYNLCIRNIILTSMINTWNYSWKCYKAHTVSGPQSA